jgi:hypothetical protein
MKKIYLLCLAFILLCFKGFSQETNKTNSQNFNEIKLNALLLVTGAFDITYERTLNKKSGLGFTFFIPYDNEDINYYIAPYYRHYFGKKYASGFFLEGFGMLNSQNIDRLTGKTNTIDFLGILITTRESLPEKITDFGLGVGLGSKWVTRNGIIFEFNFGVGRNLFQDYNTTKSSAIIGKAAISIGFGF